MCLAFLVEKGTAVSFQKNVAALMPRAARSRGAVMRCRLRPQARMATSSRRRDSVPRVRNAANSAAKPMPRETSRGSRWMKYRTEVESVALLPMRLSTRLKTSPTRCSRMTARSVPAKTRENSASR